MKSKQENPYLSAKQEWNDIFANQIIAKRNWQKFSLIQLGIILVLSMGIIRLGTKAKVIPYIVEVDKVGRAIAYAPATQLNILDEKIIRAHLYRFLEKSRSIVRDAGAMRMNLEEGYKIVSLSVKQNILDPYYQTNNPFETAKKLSRQVIPVTFLKQSKNTYLIEWKEIDRDLDNKIIIEKQWKALVTIARLEDDTKERIKQDPFNPFGIYITSLSWDQSL